MKVWEVYLKKLDQRKRDLVIYVLATAKKHAPDSVESMPYGVPGLKLNNKPIIAVAAHKNHLGIYPFSPKVVEEIKSELKNAEVSKGTIRYPLEVNPPEDIIKKLVKLSSEEVGVKKT